MHILLVLLTFFYVIIILRLRRGITQLKSGTNQKIHSVSVVIAARNESENIGHCIESLLAQHYPADRYEVIIVDDRSTDDTADIVSSYSSKFDRVKLIRIVQPTSEMAPKKNALSQGIDNAQGEIILTTDADCITKPGWISAMNRQYDEHVGLVAGFSPLDRAKKQSLFSRLVQLDALSLAAVAAGSFGAGFPLTCNGRNLSYRTRVFHEIGGFLKFGQYVSGDDDLLLHHVVRHTNWETRYVLDPDSTVSSEAPATFSHFFHQRTRHASKGSRYSFRMTLSLVAVYLMNVLLMILPLLALWSPELWKYFLGCIIVKSVAEYSLVQRAARQLRLNNLIDYFPIAVLFHIPYVVIFGLWGQFGKFRWKGTTYQTAMKPKPDTH
ncbi:glycosyltransferase [candidate division KSB1 bacterium]|nr:glycosyltransferase [candidate division KSB1 bacterium]